MAADTANRFDDLTKPELLAVADMFAVDVKDTLPKAAIIRELHTMGVDFEQYMNLTRIQAEHEDEAEELIETLQEEVAAPVVAVVVTEEAPEEDFLVIKMTRNNVAFQIGHYKWTRDHPYVLVAAEDADYILETEEGFRRATPKELREFYGKD